MEVLLIPVRLKEYFYEAISITDRVAGNAFIMRYFRAMERHPDLSLVWPKFGHWLLVDPICGQLSRVSFDHDTIKYVAALYGRWINGEKPSDAVFESVFDIDINPSSELACYAAVGSEESKAQYAVQLSKQAPVRAAADRFLALIEEAK